MAAIQIFTDINFAGVTTATITEPVTDLTNFNDQISSFKIFSGEWMLCSDANFSGVCLVLGPGEYPDVRQLDGRFNDTISSLKPTVQ